MLDLLRGLKSLVKLSHVQIDSSIFRLHYTITVMACLAFSLLVTARQYVGNPIDCVHTKDIPEVRQDTTLPGVWRQQPFSLLLATFLLLKVLVSHLIMSVWLVSEAILMAEQNECLWKVSVGKMIELFFNSNQKVSISYNGLSDLWWDLPSSFYIFN